MMDVYEAAELGLIDIARDEDDWFLAGAINPGAVIAEIDYEGIERALEDWDI